MSSGLSPAGKRPWFLPLNNPPVVAAGEAAHMRDDDPIVGVVVDDQVRAYPWWILANYHLANDTFITSDEPGGYLWSAEMTGTGEPGYPWFPTTPVVVTLCEACSAASAFVPIADGGDEGPLVFTLAERSATSGYRALGTFTIADLATHSRWHPFTGYAHSGPLEGEHLRRLPAFVDHWGPWRRDHPSTTVVLAGEEMRRRPHVVDLPGILDRDVAHTSLREVRLRRPELVDHRLDQADLVVGVGDAATGTAIAVPVTTLRARGGSLEAGLAGRRLLFRLTGAYRATAFDIDPDDGQLTLAPDGYLSKWGEWSLAHPKAEIIA